MAYGKLGHYSIFFLSFILKKYILLLQVVLNSLGCRKSSTLPAFCVTVDSRLIFQICQTLKIKYLVNYKKKAIFSAHPPHQYTWIIAWPVGHSTFGVKISNRVSEVWVWRHERYQIGRAGFAFADVRVNNQGLQDGWAIQQNREVIVQRVRLH